MLKRNNRKGFTLAELLIVVAIIAVLTAIAVPLFVTALNKAQERVGEANCRAIRGLAIETILSDQETYKLTGADKVEKWLAKATVGEDGEVDTITITADSSAALTDDDAYTAVGTNAQYKYDSGSYAVEVIIEKTDVA